MVTDQRKPAEAEKMEAPAAPSPTRLSVPASVWVIFIVLLVFSSALFFALGRVWHRPTATRDGKLPQIEYYNLGQFSWELRRSANPNVIELFRLAVTLELSTEANTEETRKLLDMLKVRITDKISRLLLGTPYEKAISPETHEEVRRKIKVLVEEEIGPQRIAAVWFGQVR